MIVISWKVRGFSVSQMWQLWVLTVSPSWEYASSLQIIYHVNDASTSTLEKYINPKISVFYPSMACNCWLWLILYGGNMYHFSQHVSYCAIRTLKCRNTWRAILQSTTSFTAQQWWWHHLNKPVWVLYQAKLQDVKFLRIER